MAELKHDKMSIESFLDWQIKQDKLYELVDGLPKLSIKMMAGASANHDTVTVNAIASLHGPLRGTPCRPRTDDIAVQIPAGNIRRPDVLIECGKPGSKDMTADEPHVVIEVLSPSTMGFDRFRKLEEYKTVDSLTAILLVDTESPQVTIHRRNGNSWYSETVDSLDAVIEFPEIKAKLALIDLYEGVEFTSKSE